jgi:hypothetical protein
MNKGAQAKLRYSLRAVFANEVGELVVAAFLQQQRRQQRQRQHQNQHVVTYRVLSAARNTNSTRITTTWSSRCNRRLWF